MVVLDTNVLSEVLKPMPSGSVLRWLAGLDREEVFTTSITAAEILYGVEVLPAGKRRVGLATAVESMFARQFSGRILPFDEEAARLFPAIVRKREKAGGPMSQSDAVIAAICRSRGAVLATRNVADFELCGISRPESMALISRMPPRAAA